MSAAARPRILVNYWYANPVGHAIEAARYCQGYRAANPDAFIGLLVNAGTAVEMLQQFDFIDEVYPVAFNDFTGEDNQDARAALYAAAPPRDWDYVVENHRAADGSHASLAGFTRFFEAAHEYFRPGISLGVVGKKDETPAYVPHQQLTLTLPETVRAAAATELAGRPAISVVLSGASAQRSQYPSVSSWKKLLTQLTQQHPNHTLCFIGKLAVDDRSSSCLTRAELQEVMSVCPSAVDVFDRTLLEQLAFTQASDLHLSPHTGFSFAASTVGTPWLALSGGPWHEMFFNEVPFYSVLPDTSRYPCFTWANPLPLLADDEDSEGPRTPSMSAARIAEDTPELLQAATRLMNNEITYEAALADYFPRLLAAYQGDHTRVFSFENVHAPYLP